MFLLAKILGGIGFLLILLQILFFKTGKKKDNKYLTYTVFLIIISVNISIWVIAVANS